MPVMVHKLLTLVKRGIRWCLKIHILVSLEMALMRQAVIEYQMV